VGDYVIDVFKDDEMVRSVAGKWKDDGEAGAMAAYYLGPDPTVVAPGTISTKKRLRPDAQRKVH
jgi:hypothetical protein